MNRPLRCKIWSAAGGDRKPANDFSKFLRRHGVRRVVFAKQADAVLLVATDDQLIKRAGEALQAMHVVNSRCRFVVVADGPVVVPADIHGSVRSFWGDEDDIQMRVLAAIRQK